MNTALRASASASFIVFSHVLAPMACSSSSSDTDGSGTTGKRIALTVKVVGSAESTAPFTNAQGWNVSLSKALVSTGPLYFYDGATIFSQLVPRPRGLGRPIDWLSRALGEKTAFAHPGHYIPGIARGELLTSSSVDLRAGAEVGAADGITGIVRSATFSFRSPASGPFASELGPHVVVLEGIATKAGQTRVFKADLDAADVDNAKKTPAVEGCPFTETEMRSDGVVTVTVHVTQWFDQVEFDAVPVSTDGLPVAFPVDSIGRNQLVRGLKEGLSYRFAYSKP